MEDRKLQCPHCSKAMALRRIQREPERDPVAHYECKSCGVGISETIDDKDPSERTLQ